MRISDWSSDVCSSDLGGRGGDTLNGGNGNDFILFDAQDAPINGGAGFDIAQAVGSNDVVLNLTQTGIETAVGSSGSDILIGGGNSHVFIAGGQGADFIYGGGADDVLSSEEHTSELQSLMRIPYAVFSL